MYWKNKWKLGTRDTPFFFSEFFGLGKNNNKDFSRDSKISSWYRSTGVGHKIVGRENLDSLCLNWPFGVEIGLYLRQIASKIGQPNSLTNCLVFLVSLGQISLVNFCLVSKPRNFCSLFLVSHPSLRLPPRNWAKKGPATGKTIIFQQKGSWKKLSW